MPGPGRQPEYDTWAPDADFGRTVRITEYDRGEGDDELTRQSTCLMHELATHDADEPVIRAAAVAAVRQLDPGTATPQQIADAIFREAQRRVTYEDDDTLNTPSADIAGTIFDQTLISPAALLSMPRPRGNCVDFSMLVHALCRLFGLPCAYKTIAADPNSEDYSHVYAVAQIAPGNFYPLDASNAPGPGLEFDLPKGKKSKLWPNPIDLSSPPIRQRRLAGLTGYIDATGNYQDGTNPDPTYGGTVAPPDYVQGPANVFIATPPPAGGWTSILSTIANDASAIAAPLVRQASIQAPYYIAGANGAQILYDPSTGKTANAGSAAQRTPAVISQNLLIGAGVAAALLIAMSGKR